MIEPRPSTVLVVDDNAIIRRLQEAQLEALHVRLIAAADGAEALSLMKTIRPDLVLLDVVMPGMDGFRVCEALKADPETREVPVMVVTALGKDARDRSFASGADDFMRKPPNTLLLRARAMVHLRIRWGGLAHNAASAGPLLLITENPELSVSVLSGLPSQIKLLRAASMDQARAALAQGPTAVILDLELDGSVAFIRELRAAHADLPILLAHWAEDFTVLEEEHPAVDDYLELPAPPVEVRHRMRLLLRLAAAVASSRA
ncbi:MAG TPA: response regulator [Holophagaceae bacterium]|nr:response regulator [Holophagaceae bacterium]